MKTIALCPISDKQIDEQVARVNALFTVLILLAFGVSNNILIIIFLALDFFLRATIYSKYSFLGIASRNIVKYFSFKTQLINAGPKIFAARVGLLIAFMIVLSFFFSLTTLAITLASVLTLFSFLEGAFGICVACIIYPYFYKLTYGLKFR